MSGIISYGIEVTVAVRGTMKRCVRKSLEVGRAIGWKVTEERVALRGSCRSGGQIGTPGMSVIRFDGEQPTPKIERAIVEE